MCITEKAQVIDFKVFRALNRLIEENLAAKRQKNNQKAHGIRVLSFTYPVIYGQAAHFLSSGTKTKSLCSFNAAFPDKRCFNPVCSFIASLAVPVPLDSFRDSNTINKIPAAVVMPKKPVTV